MNIIESERELLERATVTCDVTKVPEASSGYSAAEGWALVSSRRHPDSERHERVLVFERSMRSRLVSRDWLAAAHQLVEEYAAPGRRQQLEHDLLALLHAGLEEGD